MVQKKKSTSQSELRQMLSLRLQIQLPLLLRQFADGARVSVPLTSGRTQSLEGVGEWGHSQLENSWMYFPHPPPGQVARGDCTCHNRGHVFCRDTCHVALPLLALEVLSFSKSRPLL